MPISTVSSVAYKNSFPSQYGDATGHLHSFNYAFADGTEGQANHKQKTPPFPVGSQVEYTITKTTDYGHSLKVARPTAAATPQPTTLRDGTPATTVPGIPTAFHGQTIGMAIKEAAADARVSLLPKELADHEHVARWVWIRASVYLKVSQAIESGKLAITTTAKTPAAPERQPEPQPAPVRPKAGPDGSVAHDDSEDVPF